MRIGICQVNTDLTVIWVFMSVVRLKMIDCEHEKESEVLTRPLQIYIPIDYSWNKTEALKS